MDLSSGYPYWAIRSGFVHSYPRLQSDHRADVAIIGGGITAALIADELSAHGHDVVVIEQRDIGWGSTSASTALIQYEIDTHMVDLAKQYGEANAVLAYRACAEAVLAIGTIARKLRDFDFERVDSLYLASRPKDCAALLAELALRERHGFDVEYLEPRAIRDGYRIDAPGAILSRLAGQLDPYRFAHGLFARVQKRGGQVFDRTAITSVEPTPRGMVLRTNFDLTIRASHVIVAGGYESQRWLPSRVAKNRSSYAVATDPVDAEALGALTTTMVWESARPYLYLRTTKDRCLVIGGLDDAVDVPARRDARVWKRANALIDRVRQMLPHVPILPTYAWAGTFAETRDGLPFFGPHPALSPRLHFACAYGGNGITYSAIGAGLLRANLERRAHPLRALFAFSRI